MKKALLQIHAAVLLWGFTGVLGKAITLEAPVLVWYRMLLTAVLMAVILTWRRQWVAIARSDLIQLTIVGLLMGLHWVAFYGSIKLSNASIALVCLSTTPVFTTFFHQLFTGEKFRIQELMLGVIALAGMVMIYKFQEFYALGILLGIVAAMLAALFTEFNKKLAHKYPARTMVFYEMMTGLILISLLMPLQFWYEPQTRITPTPEDFVWLLVLSLCCTVWAQSLALNALKKISSFTATLSVNLEPVYGIILAFIFYKENKELSWGFFVGMGLILLSVLAQVVWLLKPRNYIRQKGGIE